MSGRWFAPVIVLMASILTTPPTPAESSAPTTQPTTRAARPSDAQIQPVIRQLNHPSPAKRRAAIRQLAEWGPLVFPQLRRAAQSTDLEAALSARELLRELEGAVLLGANVWLEVDHPRVAWNEPFSLTVHATNPADQKIEAPWPAAPSATTQPALTNTTTQPESSPPLNKGGPGGVNGVAEGRNSLSADVRQVGAMMDAGDFLIVTDPDGHEIDLRVEPIERDPQIYAAVNLRARDKPPSHPLPAGASDQLIIALFNRGWARYPMLAAGQYTIQFSYQPQWNDESWTKDGFGLVRSAPITIEITNSAPEPIRKAATPLRLVVQREGDVLQAELISDWDREFWINLNPGGDLKTRAQIEWRVVPTDSGDETEAIPLESEQKEDKFSAERLHLLRPGERLTIGRTTVTALREQIKQMEKPPEHPEVTIRYVSLPTPAQIREELAANNQPPVEIPADLFSGTLMSEPIALDPK